MNSFETEKIHQQAQLGAVMTLFTAFRQAYDEYTSNLENLFGSSNLASETFNNEINLDDIESNMVLANSRLMGLEEADTEWTQDED